MGHPSPKYTAEFKQRAVEPTASAAARTPSSPASSAATPAAYRTGSGGPTPRGPPPTGTPFQMAEEPRGPRRENDRPRTENEILFESRRLLRQPSAVGAAAKRAEFAFISANEGSWRVSGMRSALGAAGGHCAWRRRGPSARDERDPSSRG